MFTPAPLPTAELDDTQRLACVRLIRSQNVGPITFRELINRYGGAQQALEALPHLSRKAAHGKAIVICSVADAEAELTAAQKYGARPLFTIEPGYPLRLAQIEAPPPLVYAKGDIALLARPSIGIVGARQASAAGTKLARLFGQELGRAGLVIVSGLARGIDRAAHEASLETGTIAVLAGGLDNVYPPENASLHTAIAERGCLVSEMPCGFQPRGQDFPRRNRLISGISLGVLVVEAAKRSGTLSTARRAAEQNRDIFAIPGNPLDPRAEGTNHLLKTGATLVTEPRDVIEALKPLTGLKGRAFREITVEHPTYEAEPLAPVPEPGEEERDRVLATLGAAPVAVDDIVRATGLDIRVVRAALIELDLAGLTERHGAQLVSLANDPI
ncbi:MAG: DNA processing protein DprA [Alphaproteobacteria bacterium BRH_c36]|nr:MAG: DNA processing protein DprA [Alphaproteobacteria bacterium BRH_c36]